MNNNMKKNLILDPLQHCPGISLLFDNVDYWTKFTPAVQGEPLYRDRNSFIEYYGFIPKQEIELKDKYDAVYVVLPMYAVVGIDRPELFVKLIEDLYRIIESKKPKTVSFFDSHDNAYAPIEYFNEKGYQLNSIFKTNCRTQAKYSYDDRVKPFPFFCFGPIDPLWIALTNKDTGLAQDKRIKKCFWGSGAGGRLQPGMRPDIEDRVLRAISFDRDKYINDNSLLNLLVQTSNLSHSDFMGSLRSHRSFLVLSGTGKVHRRFFEGMSSGCLALVEKNDIIYPEYVEKVWNSNDRCTFDSVEDLKILIEKINYNELYYYTCIAKQNTYFEKVINKFWLRDYIEKNQ